MCRCWYPQDMKITGARLLILVLMLVLVFTLVLIPGSIETLLSGSKDSPVGDLLKNPTTLVVVFFVGLLCGLGRWPRK